MSWRRLNKRIFDEIENWDILVGRKKSQKAGYLPFLVDWEAETLSPFGLGGNPTYQWLLCLQERHSLPWEMMN